MAFPKTDADCLNDLDDYNALVNYVNDLTAWYNLRTKFETGTTGTTADLPLMVAGDCWNLPTFWNGLQNRLSLIVQECVDWNLITAGRITPDFFNVNRRGMENVHLYRADEGTTAKFARLCSLANAELSAAGITGQDLDSTNWHGFDSTNIPFTRKPSGERGPLQVLDQTFGLQATRDCIDATIVNQIWAVCKVLESCAFYGVIQNNGALSQLGGTIVSGYKKNLTTTLSGSTCAATLASFQANWPGTWSTGVFSSSIGATVIKETPAGAHTWTGNRVRGKFEFTDVPTGSDVDVRDFVVYRGDDFVDTAETQNAMTDITTTTGNASATYTSAYYGDYAVDPTQGANLSIDCSDSDGTYSYQVDGFIVFRKNFTAPS
jgi:hypothetical protein